jgi:broad specificity phosphatase PhoE
VRVCASPDRSQQARALGESLANVPFVHIYASDLKRATSTAQALQAAQTVDPQPPLTRSELLREQHFGIAEGKPWAFHNTKGMTLEEHYAKGIFPVPSDPVSKFPGGESTQDLAARATQAVEEIIMPHIWKVARSGERGVSLAVVSHGLCISQLIPALLRKAVHADLSRDYSGLRNTAWTKVEVDLKVSCHCFLCAQ